MGLFFLAWALLGSVSVPVEVLNAKTYDINNEKTNNGPLSGNYEDIRLSVIEFAGCLFALIGWVLFVVFAGVGLVALPLDLI